VGLNETYFTKEPPSDLLEKFKNMVGPAILTDTDWQALWEASGLNNRVVKLYAIETGQEIRGRLQWVGARWAIRGFGRLIRLYLRYPEMRKQLAQMFDAPTAVLDLMGYGLFTGQKP
jgi:hypothetical protein